MSKDSALEESDPDNSTSTGIGEVPYDRKVLLRLRQPFAEFLGVCILTIFGTGVDCQVVLSGDSKIASSPRGSYISINVGWAAGTALGVWVAGGISGAHINPAVTLTMAIFRGFPWRKVPVYVFAQILGGVVGAAVIYANYFHAIDLFEGPGVRTLKTAGLFSTYALDYMTNISAFFNEFLATVVLIIVILAINDKKNMPPPRGLAPVALFILVLAIGTSLGMQTGYGINPARDLGPRIMTAMVGYGAEVFTYRSHYWIWCAVLGPIAGGLFGALVYDAFLYDGFDNIFLKGELIIQKVQRVANFDAIVILMMFERHLPFATLIGSQISTARLSIQDRRMRYMNRDELAELMKSDKTPKKDFIVVDVRDDDFVGGNIKGAINQPSHEFLMNVDGLVKKTKDIPLVIFHCALSQVRGPKAARVYAETRKNILEDKDIDHEVVILREGFTAFQAKYRHDPELVEDWDKNEWEPEWYEAHKHR